MKKKTIRKKTKRITKKEVLDAFLKRPTTKISPMELSFFLKLYDSDVEKMILKDGKMDTAIFKKLEKSELVEIDYLTKYGQDIARKTPKGKELYKKFDAFRSSYATEKMGGSIDFSKKVSSPKSKTVMAKKRTTTRRKPTSKLASDIEKLQNKMLSKPTRRKKTTAKPKKKPTKAQTKARRSAAAKKAYKGSKLEAINKSATALQKASGTKLIRVPNLSRSEATKRAARLYKKR